MMCEQKTLEQDAAGLNSDHKDGDGDDEVKSSQVKNKSSQFKGSDAKSVEVK